MYIRIYPPVYIHVYLNMKTTENSSKPMSKKKVLDLSGSPNFRSTSQKVYRLTPWTLFFVSNEGPGMYNIYIYMGWGMGWGGAC